jgi:hypothetical protein
MADEAWIPVVYETAKPPDKVQMAGPYFDNVDDTDFELMFRLPLPGIRGGQRLHIDGIKIGVFDADPANYVSKLTVYGVAFNSNDSVFVSEEPINSPQVKSHSFPATDVSNWESIMVRVWCSVSVARDLNISSVLLHCYYG